MSAADVEPARHQVVELQPDKDGRLVARVAGRPIYAYWPMLAPYLRHVLLAPHRHFEDSFVQWEWDEPASTLPLTGTELAGARRAIREAVDLLRDLAGHGHAHHTLLAEVAVALQAWTKQMIRWPDHEFSRFACRTRHGVMLHSWGCWQPAARVAGPTPDSADRSESTDKPPRRRRIAFRPARLLVGAGALAALALLTTLLVRRSHEAEHPSDPVGDESRPAVAGGVVAPPAEVDSSAINTVHSARAAPLGQGSASTTLNWKSGDREAGNRSRSFDRTSSESFQSRQASPAVGSVGAGDISSAAPSSAAGSNPSAPGGSGGEKSTAAGASSAATAGEPARTASAAGERAPRTREGEALAAGPGRGSPAGETLLAPGEDLTTAPEPDRRSSQDRPDESSPSSPEVARQPEPSESDTARVLTSAALSDPADMATPRAPKADPIVQVSAPTMPEPPPPIHPAAPTKPSHTADGRGPPRDGNVEMGAATAPDQVTSATIGSPGLAATAADAERFDRLMIHLSPWRESLHLDRILATRPRPVGAADEVNTLRESARRALRSEQPLVFRQRLILIGIMIRAGFSGDERFEWESNGPSRDGVIEQIAPDGRAATLTWAEHATDTANHCLRDAVTGREVARLFRPDAQRIVIARRPGFDVHHIVALDDASGFETRSGLQISWLPEDSRVARALSPIDAAQLGVTLTEGLGGLGEWIVLDRASGIALVRRVRVEAGAP